jgi:carboxyl-terminal processing protease
MRQPVYLACCTVALLSAAVWSGTAQLEPAAFSSANTHGRSLLPAQKVLVPRALFFMEELSRKDRLATFEKIWHSIRENYYDPDLNGVNWDEIHQRYRPWVETVTTDRDFYKLMERMAGELHDAHTHVLEPFRAENFKKQQHVSLGIGTGEFDGKLVITNVKTGSAAAQAGIVPGMTIESVDGKRLAEKLAEIAPELPHSSSDRASRMLLYAMVLGQADQPGSTVRLGLQRLDGSRFEATLTRDIDPLSGSVTAKVLPSGNVYMTFQVFYPPAAREFRDALQKFKNAPGMIIDLRRNPGGSGQELMSIAGNFFDAKTVFARNKLRTRDTRPVYVESKDGQAYAGPVVILVTQYSGSSSELFAGGMQDVGRAKVVGSQTCGCVLGVSHPVELKGGGLVMISKVLWFTPSGRKLEGEGVIPDKVVIPTLSDVIQRHDPVLEAGDKLLQEMLPSKTVAAH